MIYAYCWASGLIELGKAVPKGAIEIVRGNENQVKRLIDKYTHVEFKKHARKEGKTKFHYIKLFTVIDDENEKLRLLLKFSKWLKEILEKGNK
jgi:hypothetical protein